VDEIRDGSSDMGDTDGIAANSNPAEFVLKPHEVQVRSTLAGKQRTGEKEMVDYQ